MAISIYTLAINGILLFALYKLLKWFFYPYQYYKSTLHRKTPRLTFHTGDSNTLVTSFDLITKPQPTYDISIIIPSYNEQSRLPFTLDSTIDFMNKWAATSKIKWEIIIVNDGSKDLTIDVIQRYCKKSLNIKGLHYDVNCGKGAAVKRGMLCSNGGAMLMMDADLATDINDIPTIYEKLKNSAIKGKGIVVGTRKIIEKGKVVKRSGIRKLLMLCLHCILKYLCKITISDTQCGFKIFSRDAAALIFPAQHIERFAFDVELCMLAQKNGIPIEEQSVTWTEIAGSKVNIIRDTIVMARDIIITWLLYSLKIWTIKDKSDKND